MEEVSTAEWDTTVGVPLKKESLSALGDNKREMTCLLGLEEVTSIIEKHLLDTWVQDDGRHGALVTRICPAPAAMRICEVDLNTVDGLRLVLLLCLEDELLENGIATSHDAV